MKFANTTKRFILVPVFGLALSGPVFAANDAMLELLVILRDKGSLTDQEYELLRDAALADGEEEPAPARPVQAGAVNSQRAGAVNSRPVAAVAPAQVAGGAGAGHWSEKIEIDGDIRLRYQGNYEGGEIDRDRGRFRYRLNVTANPDEHWQVGAGLASGGTDLRSTNQSFDSTFSSKGLQLDYAYGQYTLNDNFKAIAGKFKKSAYLYTPTDMAWDGDINPEGLGLNFAHGGGLGTTFANSGIWVMEENSGSKDDPYLAYGQLGQRFASERFFGSLAGAFYSFRDITSLDPTPGDGKVAAGQIVTDGTNTDFRFKEVFGLSGEWGTSNVFGAGLQASLLADFIHNADTNSSEDTGFTVGFSTSRSAWSFKYLYTDLEENAFPDILPDSDRFDGLTGFDGHEFILDYELTRNVTLGLDFYSVEQKKINRSQNLLQVDVVVDF